MMNCNKLIQQLAQLADIQLVAEPYRIIHDDYISLCIPYDEPNHYQHAHIPLERCDDFWYHYIDLNINVETLSINIIHSFHNPEQEIYCFLRGALLFYDSLYDQESIQRVVGKLKELKTTLNWGYFPPEYYEFLSEEEIHREFKERKFTIG